VAFGGLVDLSTHVLFVSELAGVQGLVRRPFCLDKKLHYFIFHNLIFRFLALSHLADAALLGPPHDPGAISEAILQLFTNHTLASSLVAKGYDRVESFSWERCAKRTFELYEELLNS